MNFNKSLFQNNLIFLTYPLIFLYSALIPINTNKIDEILHYYTQFSNTFFIILAGILGFIAIGGKELIPPNLFGNALNSMGLSLIFIATLYLFLISAKNVTSEENKIIIFRITTGLMLTSLLTIISLISGITFLN